MQNTNASSAELDHFDRFASQFWDADGPFKTLHQVNPVRMDFIRGHSTLQGKLVLDCGCGGGILSEALAKAGADVTGIDLSAPGIDTAKQHAAPELSIRYLLQSAESLALEEPGRYDVIAMMELIEHVPDPASLLKACDTLLKPGGILFVSTLNRTLRSFLEAIVLGEYVLGWIPKGTHHYQQLIKPSELISEARALGLSIQAITGIRYQPIYRQFVLASEVGTNYIACFHKPS